jgi:hypothetical protein
MNRKITLLSLCCFLSLVVIAMGGCIGYAGSVDAAGTSANKSTASPVSATPTNVSFGSVVVGSNSAQSVSVKNAGSSAVVLASLSSSNKAFSASGLTFPMTLKAGHSATMTVAFSPGAAGAASGTISVVDGTGTPTAIAVSGTGTAKQLPGVMQATPASLSVGSVAVGSAGSGSFSVTNTGGMTAILQSVSSSSAQFVASGPTFPMNINPGQTVPFNVAFTPTATGVASATITVGSNASNAPTTIAVSGTGTAKQLPGVLSASPASISLGNATVGSSASQTFNVTNTGGMTAILSSLSSSSAAFVASGPTFPMNILPGQSVPFKVTFTPTAAGAASATITVGSNASNAPTAVAVSGAGTAAATAPTISSQPSNQTVNAGQTATFAVTASGTGPLSYQWQKNGAAISGATSASYTTPATTSADNAAKFTAVVSNSAGNVTSSAATLTVNAAPTISLNANPASLSFGSVNVGSNSALSVTYTNAGTANVTVSNVTVSGAGFNATGISAGQVVAAGKTATLNVTFAPAASGALTGSVTVTSNATNSPSTVALSGTGAAATSSSDSGAPTCGISGDTTNHVPTDWTTFVPPAKGQSYVDPTFGCTVTRVTDSSTEVWGGSFYLPIGMGYATVSPFNANDTYLMLGDGWGRHFVTDLQGNVVVSIANMPDCGNSSSCTPNNSSNDTWFYWDATNPDVFYYTNGNSMMKGVISGSNVTTSTVHQFTEYQAVNFIDKTDLSEDGAHVVIAGGDTSGNSPENIFDYDFVTNLKGPVYTTGCNGTVGSPNNSCVHGVTQTPDNNLAIDFANDGSGAEQGVRLWDGSNPLPHLQDGTNHMDTGYDMNGSPIYVEVGNSSTVAGETNPCPSGWGLDVRQIYDTGSAVCLIDNQPSWHVGYRGNANQPWVTLSFFDTNSSGPEWFDNSGNYSPVTPSNWYLYEDEIMVVRIDANNNSKYVYRLARAYSRSDEDFYAQPHAAMSRDGRYIAFQSNVAYAHTGCPANFQTTTGCTDVYVLKVK